MAKNQIIKLRAQLWQRCAGYCELCGLPLEETDWALHHRKLKSRGGKDELCNVVALHHKCHNLGTKSVHLNPEWATTIGFMVASWDNPEQIALTIPLHGRVTLTNDGGVVTANDK